MLLVYFRMQLTERRRGNDCFKKGLLEDALRAYRRAKSILDTVEGMAQETGYSCHDTRRAALACAACWSVPTAGFEIAPSSSI